MIMFLIAAGLGDPTAVGTPELVAAAKNSVAAESALPAPLDGEVFSASVAFTSIEHIGADAAHSPAVWSYSDDDQLLHLVIGGPNMRSGNYNQFNGRDIWRFGQARPFFVAVEQDWRVPVDPLDRVPPGTDPRLLARLYGRMIDRDNFEALKAFSVAVLDTATTAASPAPVRERVVLSYPMRKRDVRDFVAGLRLSVEGRLSGQPGQRVACGEFYAKRWIDDGPSWRTVNLVDMQCMIPARIHQVTLTGADGQVLESWPEAGEGATTN